MLTSLRLQKDLVEVGRLFPSLDLKQGENPSTLMVTVPLSGQSIRFAITIPKYYPHSKPKVKCIDFLFISSQFIGSNGDIVHNCLDEWNALKSLADIIRMLEILCSSLMLVHRFN